MGLTQEMLDSLNLDDTQKAALQRTIDEDSRTATELAEYRKREKESGRAERLALVKSIFGEDQAGLIAEFDALLMADDNDVAASLMLSDATGRQVKTNLTITQVIDRLLAAMPKPGDSAAKTALAQKATLLQNPLEGRPNLKPDPTELSDKPMTGDELAAQWASDLGGSLDLALPATPAAK